MAFAPGGHGTRASSKFMPRLAGTSLTDRVRELSFLKAIYLDADVQVSCPICPSLCSRLAGAERQTAPFPSNERRIHFFLFDCKKCYETDTPLLVPRCSLRLFWRLSNGLGA